MKRYILAIIMMLTMSFTTVSAQNIMWFKTTAYAQATIINGKYYWGEWQGSNMDVCISLVSDKIIIYSPTTQIYKVIDSYNAYTDSSGGRQVKFKVIDQDNDVGYIRLRIEKNGNSQIYVDFSNVAWVYNVVRTN